MTSLAETAPSVPPATRQRIQSLDIVRGAVMVLMALDHVRVYSGLPPGGPTAGIFFTRWVTHFCAPAFIFLAGTSAFLNGKKLGDRGALARLLVSRGAWLVLLELTVLRVGWTFNPDFGHYLLAGVIWVIGWCMILLAAARLPAHGRDCTHRSWSSSPGTISPIRCSPRWSRRSSGAPSRGSGRSCTSAGRSSWETGARRSSCCTLSSRGSG